MNYKNYNYSIFALLICFLFYFIYQIIFFNLGFFFDFFLFTVLLIFYFLNYIKNIKLRSEFYYFSIFFILLNILGYMIDIEGIRLYDYWLNEYFRFDNLIHFIGAIVLVLYLDKILFYFFKQKTKFQENIYLLILIFLVLGLGAFHEIIELFSVIFFNGGDKIGDYMNNALDLFYNFLGGLTAFLFLKFR
jgi:hypothetical protein